MLANFVKVFHRVLKNEMIKYQINFVTFLSNDTKLLLKL